MAFSHYCIDVKLSKVQRLPQETCKETFKEVADRQNKYRLSATFYKLTGWACTFLYLKAIPHPIKTIQSTVEVILLVANIVLRSHEGAHFISGWITFLTRHLHTIKAPFKPLRGRWVLLIRREATQNWIENKQEHGSKTADKNY